MENKDTRILEVSHNSDGNVVGYIANTSEEEEVLMAYSLLTHAVVIFLATKYEGKYDCDIERAFAEAWRKVAFAFAMAHEHSEELSEEAEVKP